VEDQDCAAASAERTDVPSALGVILGRRSVRSHFTEQPIERRVLEQIIGCGLAAPSSKNAQPWRLHVVQDRQVLRTLADLVASAEGADEYVPHDPTTGLPYPVWSSTVRESADVLRAVAAGIFVENCGPFSRGRAALARASREALVGSLVGYTLELVGIGTAVENMWIAAAALGVSVAFMGDVVIAEAQIKRLLSIEGDLVGVLALGYSTSTVGSWRPPDGTTRVVWH
jgi:nitroreductase